MDLELLGAFDEAQRAQLAQAGNELEIGEQRRHARERSRDRFDADAAARKGTLAQELGERLGPLRAHRHAAGEPRMLGVDGHLVDPQDAALARAAQVVGGQLVHERERRAIERHHHHDRPLPGLHVDVKIGRPLKKIRAREGERVETVRAHHLGHQAAAVVERGAREEGHGMAPQLNSGSSCPAKAGYPVNTPVAVLFCELRGYWIARFRER
jgi:hypothetical protein